MSFYTDFELLKKGMEKYELLLGIYRNLEREGQFLVKEPDVVRLVLISLNSFS